MHLYKLSKKEEELEKLCNVLPDNLKGECTTLVKQYGSQILQLLAAELKPDVVCKVLGFCSGFEGEMKVTFFFNVSVKKEIFIIKISM